MAKRVNRVRYSLNKGDVKDLPREEIEKILRAADDLIMKGGRNMLVTCRLIMMEYSSSVSCFSFSSAI